MEDPKNEPAEVEVCLVKPKGIGLEARLNVVKTMYRAIHGRDLTTEEVEALRQREIEAGRA